MSPLKNEVSEVLEEVANASRELLRFYKFLYTKRFGVPDLDVAPSDLNDIADVVLSFVKTNLSIEQIVDTLGKAMIWFLFAHDTKNKSGVQFSHSLKTFVNQGWLLKICIETTRHFSFDDLQEKIKNAKTKETINAFIKELKSNKFENKKVAEVRIQSIILKIENVIKHNQLKGSAVRNLPQFIQLYENKNLDSEYLSAAESYLLEFIDHWEKNENI